MRKVCMFVMMLALAFFVTAAQAEQPPAGHGEAAGMPPQEALAKLKQGNQRFASGKWKHPNTGAKRRKDTALEGQHPFAIVLGCADSRVPVETIFDQGVGDIFTIRVAGNVSDTDEVGSIEYAVEHLGTRLIVVLGHTKCGAVTAVVKGAEVSQNISQLVDNIRPAVDEAKRLNPGIDGDALIPAATEVNIKVSINDMLSKSQIIREAKDSGKLLIVGALYDLETGAVKWLDEPEAKKDEKKQGHGEAPGISADEAQKMLAAGNARFVSGKTKRPNVNRSRRVETATKGQNPFAIVLSCADSRVPVETIFDRGIGDIFVIRDAGNIAGEIELGSIEYAVEHLGTRLVVVLGHSKCGAVTAAVKGGEAPGNIPRIVEKIQPAVAKAKTSNPGVEGDALIPAAIESNVNEVIAAMLRDSTIVREASEKSGLKVMGATYDVESGKVSWLNPAK